MYSFPRDLYVDVRVEDSVTTEIRFKQRALQGQKVRRTKGALIRVFDGTRWYYASTTDLDNIQAQIDSLAQMAKPNPQILEHPLIKAFEVNKETLLRYEQDPVTEGNVVISQISGGHQNDLQIEIVGTKRTIRWRQEDPEILWIGERGGCNQIRYKDGSAMGAVEDLPCSTS